MRLIDADEAKKALTGWETDPTDEEIEYTIDNLPTVDAEPVKHGRWKGSGMGDHCCSLCSEEVSGYYYAYCPYCGAKMEVE